MTTTFSGPMFQPSEDRYRENISGKRGGHYNTYAARDPDSALAMLRTWFSDDSQINEMNFVLFSTSGVHGTYHTIEEVERDIRGYGDTPHDPDGDDDRCSREVTFLLVQPRIVGMTYGNCACPTLSDVRFLKRLRRLSWKAAGIIGKDGK